MKNLILIIALILPLTVMGQYNARVDSHQGLSFAYLSGTSPTTTTNAGQYYYLEGTFTNELSLNFAIVSDTLTYQGVGGLSLIAFTSSFSSDTNNTEITIGVKKNGVIEVNSQMTVEANLTTDIVSLALIDVLPLQTGDNISLWVKSDKAGAQITAESVTTAIIIIR